MFYFSFIIHLRAALFFNLLTLKQLWNAETNCFSFQGFISVLFPVVLKAVGLKAHYGTRQRISSVIICPLIHRYNCEHAHFRINVTKAFVPFFKKVTFQSQGKIRGLFWYSVSSFVSYCIWRSWKSTESDRWAVLVRLHSLEDVWWLCLLGTKFSSHQLGLQPTLFPSSSYLCPFLSVFLVFVAVVSIFVKSHCDFVPNLLVTPTAAVANAPLGHKRLPICRQCYFSCVILVIRSVISERNENLLSHKSA